VLVRRLVIALLALVLATTSFVAFAPAASAQDDPGGGNSAPANDAVAVNTHDGKSVFDLAFSVRSITSSTAAPENAAVAYASCTDCQTVAIAVQIVFVVGSPDVFTPVNEAIAINDQCSMCDTLATAYQFVVQEPVAVRFTSEGKQRIHDIEKALRDLQNSGLSAVEMQAQIDDLMKQLADVIANDVEPIPGHADDASTSSSTSPSSSSSSSNSTTTSTTGSTTSTSTSIASDSTTTTTSSSSSSS
jgi:putative peptide zinc metalloprotease protein